MKIYTRTGDDGSTSLSGGQRVPKYHDRIEAYGTVDELISWIGLLRDLTENSERVDFLEKVQDKLMHCAAILSAGPGARTDKIKPPQEEDVEQIEKEIDTMEEGLEPLSSFILPGGHPAVSYAHVGRTVCRRAERCVLRLANSEDVNEGLIKYLNRLSDYLFILARKTASDTGSEQSKWIP